jgi:hypothetical protein
MTAASGRFWWRGSAEDPTLWQTKLKEFAIVTYVE